MQFSHVVMFPTFLALVLVPAALGSPNFHDRAQPSFKRGAHVPKNRIVLKTKASIPHPENASSINKRKGIASIDVAPEEDIDSKLNELMQRADYAIKDTLVWATGGTPSTNASIPNDPEFRFQWGMSRVGAPEAWKTLNESSSALNKTVVTVCVVDSGIDAAHPDIAAKLDPQIGYNAITKTSNVSDELKHGTHVAGIVAAIVNNDMAVAGVASDHVQVLSCKFLSGQGYGYASDAVACIEYCIDNGADVITNSWSGSDDNPALRDAIQDAEDKDVLFVVAAGNTGSNLDVEPAYPAAYDAEFSNMLVVASTDYLDRMSNFSNYGEHIVHIGAPGEWILSLVPYNDTAYYSGTSMAAPLAAGAAAIALAASRKTLSAAQLKQIVIETAEPLVSLKGKVSSGGILRADKVLEAAVARRRKV